MNSGNISITTDDISVTYNNGHRAIYDVSIELGAYTTCALVGVNGSGKSTLFKSIMGLVTPQTGSILIGGMPVKKALKRSQVAYVPQSEDIDWDFPILVRDVVMQGRYGFMGFFRKPSQIDQLAVDNAMDRLGIQDLGSRQIGELSGGQKKRVFLARALAQKSKIILLDEPFTGVDVKTENAIMELMQELQDEGYLMLVSTHNLGSVSGYCNKVILLNRTVIASGPTETTYTQENLEKTFGGILKHIHLGGSDLHDDADERKVTIITDDERPAVFYGKTKEDPPVNRLANGSKTNSSDTDSEPHNQDKP